MFNNAHNAIKGTDRLATRSLLESWRHVERGARPDLLESIRIARRGGCGVGPHFGISDRICGAYCHDSGASGRIGVQADKRTSDLLDWSPPACQFCGGGAA